MSSETNTLRIALPTGVSLRSATDALRRFGEVSHVQVLPGQNLAVSAVFFDVRAAVRARSVLGPGCCQADKQTGCRMVKLPGNVQLDVQKIRGVSRVLPEPDESGSFLVEFFDLRDAARAQELAQQKSGTIGAALTATTAKVPAKEVPEASVPAYVKPSQPFVPASVTSSLTQTQTQQAGILLRGLPKALCTSLCLEAMFEQAGLEGTIVNCRIRRGAASSEVLLSLSSRQAAKRCIQHFNGRRWSPTGEPVTATFARVNSRIGDSALDRPLRMPQKAPLPEDAEAEAAEEAMMATTASAPRSPLPECEAPPGLGVPADSATLLREAAGDKLGAKEDCSPSLATDDSTADGASVPSDQEEAA